MEALPQGSIHHTYTNVHGEDRDLGYEIVRIDPCTRSGIPVYLGPPVFNVLLAFLLGWPVAVHDLDFDAIRRGEKPQEQVLKELKGIAGKARAQIVRGLRVLAAGQRARGRRGLAGRGGGSQLLRRPTRAREALGRVKRLRRRQREDVARDIGLAVL